MKKKRKKRTEMNKESHRHYIVFSVLTLTNALTFIFLLQDVQRRATLRKVIIDL